MNLISEVLGANFFPAELFLGLRGPEQVRGQFGAPHVVENLLLWFKLFALVDVPPGQAAVKSPVAVIHENGVVQRLNHACLPGHARQVFIMLFHLRPEQEARLVFFQGRIIRQLLAARLHGKISLAQGDQGFAGIGVLDDQIAGVTGEGPIFQFASRPGTDADHFEDLLEMVFDPMIALQTCFSGPLDHGQEMPKLGVFQNACEVTGGPEFVACRADALDALKSVAGNRNGWLFAHVIPPQCRFLASMKRRILCDLAGSSRHALISLPLT